MRLFKKKPNCLGDYNWNVKCSNCEYLGRCIDFTNRRKGGRRYVLTNKKAPNTTPKQR